VQANNGYVPVDIGYRQAKQEFAKALELDPNFADALANVGRTKTNYDWDWAGADETLRQALKLEPGNRSVVDAAAHLAVVMGRLDEAVRLYRQVTQIDPVWASPYINLAYALTASGQLAEAELAIGKCLELNPQQLHVHMDLGLLFLDRGKPDSALAEMMNEPEPAWKGYGLAIAFHALGRKSDADNTLATFIHEYRNDWAYQIASIYAYRNEKEKAFEWLERAYIQRDGGLTYIKTDPTLRNIRSDPRFNEFLKKMKLPVD
jgi:tetratricopeptide (TPR) repeat protein